MRMDLLIKYVSPHTRIHTLPQDLLSKVATLTAAHEDLKGKHGPLMRNSPTWRNRYIWSTDKKRTRNYLRVSRKY